MDSDRGAGHPVNPFGRVIQGVHHGAEEEASAKAFLTDPICTRRHGGEEDKGGKRWETLRENIDLLFSRMGSIETTQQQTLIRVEINSKATEQAA